VALGPGSRLLLDKFVYDPQKGSGTIVLNLVKGAFRFVTGIASKPSYLIRVPRFDHRARDHLRHLHSGKQRCMAASARRRRAGLQRSRSMPGTRRAGQVHPHFGRRLRGSTEPVDIIARPSEHRLRQCLSFRCDNAAVRPRSHLYPRCDPARPLPPAQAARDAPIGSSLS